MSSAAGGESLDLVRVEGLSKSFELAERRLDVLRDVNLRIGRAELISLVGKSGVGKSTLLHILGTLDHPTGGRVQYEGLDVFELEEKDLAGFRNRTIGFIFQFHHLLPEFTALENVMMPALIARQPRSAARDRALSLLERVGLSERLSHRPGELSGGEQQRVAIARALVMEPKLVLADEPTGNLDHVTSDEIHELMVELNEETHTTFLIATHSHELAAQMHRHLTVAGGRLDEMPHSEAVERARAARAPRRAGR